MADFNSNIIITGYPYVFPHYFKIFRYFPPSERPILILPKVWISKTEMRVTQEPGFKKYLVQAWSYGKNSLLGGLWKGWLPSILFVLIYLRFKYRSKVIFSCLEPNLLSTLYNSFIAKCLGMKNVLFTWQNIDMSKRYSGVRRLLYKCLINFNLILSDGIICGNQKSRQIIASYNLDLKTAVFPLSGVDIDVFRPNLDNSWSDKLGIKDKEVFLFYGAMDDRKGIKYLIEAFGISKLQDAVLIIAGKGPSKEGLIKYAEELKLDDRIYFLDWLNNDDLPKLLAIADAFVYPSVRHFGWEEQFGYAMAEASASGVPVIATDTGSINEVVIDGVTGLLVEPANSEKLAMAMNEILKLDKSTLGSNGRNHIVRNFSHQVIAQKMTNFLNSFR